MVRPLLLFVLLGLLGPGVAAGEGESPAPGAPVTRNRLSKARSPYLRQHASNPVDWYPWGDEALERARELNRPIFLSVGYAACHWCHVMEHESFEDEATARLLDDVFVCVKVDREERPDLDAVYMQAVHLLNQGRGGWPMTVLLTPEGEPFFAATYLPRERLQALARKVAEVWSRDETLVRSQATAIAERLRDMDGGLDAPDFEGSDAELLDIVEQALGGAFDAANGGYGGAPKFPPHAELLYHLDRAQREGPSAGLEQALTTLSKLAEGGIRDHVGGGFHRYATDAVWFLPHFEKMLYDNALLAGAYAHAFALTGNARWAEATRDVLAWVRRDLRRPDGTYASSLDADTEGEEGLTYTWTQAELEAALTAEDAALAMRVYGATAAGNLRDEATGRRTGRNVLYLPVPLDVVAAAEGLSPAALATRLDGIRTRLLEVRTTRAQPGLDDKAITAWNGLLLSALATAGAALEDPALLAEARGLAATLLEGSRDADGLLLRFPRDDGDPIPGFCEDHVHLAEGLLDLAEATGEVRWSEAAAALADALISGFEDPVAGGFYSTASDRHENLLTRRKETFDSPIPSDNGTAAHLLLRLAEQTGEARYGEAAERTLQAFRPLMGWAGAARGTVALYRALALSLAQQRAAGSGAFDDLEADATAVSWPLTLDLFSERGTVRPGGTLEIALRLRLASGWHLVLDETTGAKGLSVQVVTPRGVGVTVLARVSGVDRVLESGAAAVRVFEDEGWFRARLEVPADRPLGSENFGFRVRFQPCRADACQEAREALVQATFEVAAEEGPRRNAGLFQE